VGYHRPYGDFTHLITDGPGGCAQACEFTDQCKAWTFVEYGRQNEGCWLKNVVSGKTNLTDGANFLTSGVKQPYSPPAPCAPKDDFAPGLDRPGGDYRTILTDGPTGCCAACYSDHMCLSWTYVESDPYVGCHMKSSLVPLVNDSCVRCTSGAKWE